MTKCVAAAVPKLLQLDIAQQWTRRRCWSPRELLSGDASFFGRSSLLLVKRSVTSRFFMYEEQGTTKLEDAAGETQVLQRSPAELAELLHETPSSTLQRRHHYWTSPVADVAPGLVKEHLHGYESLYQDKNSPTTAPASLLDPRGPSLWMGSSGSGTQAHYDVADNVIVQLYGTKRIRCYPPEAATALYVFPDAHPRARKSQVDWDAAHDDAQRMRLFPQFATLAPSVLDVVLQPGDAVRIPAFWFHHVENGRWDCDADAVEQQQQILGPSVSLNLFALSQPMMMAQAIFRDASQPMGRRRLVSGNFGFAVQALRTLAWALLKGLHQGDGIEVLSLTSPGQFIRTALLDTRYVPLQSGSDTKAAPSPHTTATDWTAADQEQAENCVARLLPQFAQLRAETGGTGVQSLVVCHLLELWAVEMVGAAAVEEVWEAVLRLEH